MLLRLGLTWQTRDRRSKVVQGAVVQRRLPRRKVVSTALSTGSTLTIAKVPSFAKHISRTVVTTDVARIAISATSVSASILAKDAPRCPERTICLLGAKAGAKAKAKARGPSIDWAEEPRRRLERGSCRSL